MPALSTLPEAMRNQLLTAAVEINTTTPFNRPVKALVDARVAVVTSAGLHLHTDKAFVASDSSYRVIPSNTRAEDILQSHLSLHFDRSAMVQDINVVFPLDRLREMADAGAIGSVASRFYSFMGAQRDVSVIKTTTAHEVAAQLLDEAVDVVLLTPT